jgi:hypothetical protein
MQDDLTSKQNDYAVFLPAISGFYATFIGKQRVNNDYVDPARLPAGLKDMETMNWLNSQKALFPYKWSLYSGGHANLDLSKEDPGEDMVRKREAGTFILGDSGGFQIGKGLWEGDWRNPNSQAVQQKLKDLAAQGTHTVTNNKNKQVTVNPLADYQKALDAAQKKRDAVLRWLDGVADYGMILDIPTWVIKDPIASKKIGMVEVDDPVEATKYNNEYFIKNRKGKNEGGAKFLNVLQGSDHTSADEWYDIMKEYCDPVKYPGRHFDGWAMGGQNMCDAHLILRRLVTLRYDNLLQEGVHDWMHFLGTSRLEWAVLLTVIQRAVRKYVNPNFTISFDCASPFLATANGQIYHEIDIEHEGKWSYRMGPAADNKKYATDTRTFRDALLQDGVFDHFDESPISKNLMMKDICIYKPGDLNKNGKEGKTSWDSFSYALMMGHNVWMHLEAVQRANRQFDAGEYPYMMESTAPTRDKFQDIVEAIFAAPDRETALAIVDSYENYWMEIIGTRGDKGKKVKNAKSMAKKLMTIEGSGVKIEKPKKEAAKPISLDHLLEG